MASKFGALIKDKVKRKMDKEQGKAKRFAKHELAKFSRQGFFLKHTRSRAKWPSS